MKNTFLTLVALSIALTACMLLMGNSGGAAANGNYYTGAPSTGGGTEGTCNTCHNSGSYGEPILSVQFAENGGAPQALTSYEPGRTYDVTLAVGFASTAPAGYGFQAQILTTTGQPATAGVLAAEAEGPVRISSGQGDRRYAEHREISNTGTFQFSWTAPAAGAGEVSLYAVGNLVNVGQGTAGDNGSSSPTIITLAEGITNGVGQLADLAGKLFPNPVTSGGDVAVEIPLKSAGEYTVMITDLSGRILQNTERSFPAGLQRAVLPTANLSPGVYVVAVIGVDGRFVRRLVVE